MIEVRKNAQNTRPITVIRAASGHELSNYEKNKLANIEDNAQENKIEVIKINGQPQQIDPVNKEVKINLGELAFKSNIASNDLASDDLFIIQCELD